MANNIDFKLKMIDQVNHEGNREMKIQTSLANIIEEIIKNSKGRQTIIETLEKVEDSHLSSNAKAFLINVCQEELKTLELPLEIMKDISEHLNLKHIFCEHMKNIDARDKEIEEIKKLPHSILHQYSILYLVLVNKKDCEKMKLLEDTLVKIRALVMQKMDMLQEIIQM
ncbi:hypothetical protein Tco_0278181 [Tanacetum coccineum]